MKTIAIAALSCFLLNGCAVVAVGSAAVSAVTLPVKVAYKATSAIAGAVVGEDDTGGKK